MFLFLSDLMISRSSLALSRFIESLQSMQNSILRSKPTWKLQFWSISRRGKYLMGNSCTNKVNKMINYLRISKRKQLCPKEQVQLEFYTLNISHYLRDKLCFKALLRYENPLPYDLCSKLCQEKHNT